tara:strand:+ start:2151 stop:4232 length:2082 start_codon:yes stop_codon:yes gene_type:complete
MADTIITNYGGGKGHFDRVKTIGSWIGRVKGLRGARPQRQSEPAANQQKEDEQPSNSKLPGSNLAEKQRIGTTGETVPIVFGKRVSSKGGVWVQPSLIKQGSKNFKGLFLYAISQGEIASSPAKVTTWTGLNNIAFLDDQTITLSNKYSTAAALSSSPTTCPIAGNGLYCGIETYSYIQGTLPGTGGKVIFRVPDRTKVWIGDRQLTLGSGDTTNNTFKYKITNVWDSETGSNITSAYFTFLGIPASTEFTANITDTGNIGRAVGTINDYTSLAAIVRAPYNAQSVSDGDRTQTEVNNWNAISGGRGAFTFEYTWASSTNQHNASNPATTGTLTGVQFEFVVSPYEDVNSTPTADNSSYADITFLEITGDLDPLPDTGTFSTSIDQLSIYYEQGVKVDLYSSGLSSGSYTNAASNQFVDLAMYLFKTYKQTEGSSTAAIAAPVYLTNLQSLATFCTNNGFTFNGVISQSVNIVEYLTKVAPFFFLSLLSDGGRYRFATILPINGSNQIDVTALTPTMTFTESNIVPGTFDKGYLSVEERRDCIASVVYRRSIPSEIGARRTVTVRYPTTAIDAPTEQWDCSDFVTDPEHAVKVAKLQLAKRKYSTHNISFATPLLTTALLPCDVIKVQRQRKSSAGDDRTEIDHYQVVSVTHSDAGLSEIVASHFPLNGSSISTISNEVVNGTFTILKGEEEG